MFHDMFASPVEVTGPEGTIVEQPISLPEVTKMEFKVVGLFLYTVSGRLHAHGTFLIVFALILQGS